MVGSSMEAINNSFDPDILLPKGGIVQIEVGDGQNVWHQEK